MLSFDDDPPIDLDAYLKRIGYTKELQLTRATLDGLHLAHALSIPFENLDILLGRPIRIDLPSIQAKLVAAERGGYCFEHNRLFAAVLKTIGFSVTFLAGRVRYLTERVLPRTHLLLLVEVERRQVIADVGFGTAGLLWTVPLVSHVPVEQFGWNYRLIEELDVWTLQTLQSGEWHNLYSFTLEPQHLVDLEMANYYVSSNPNSRFVQTLVAQRSTASERYLLRNYDLIVDRAGETATTAISDQEELLKVLAERFDLHFPSGTVFQFKGQK